MRKKFLAVVVAAATLFSAVPVFGAEEDLLTFEVTSIESEILESSLEGVSTSETENLIDSESVSEAEGVVADEATSDGLTGVALETEGSEAGILSERYVSEETDTFLTEELALEPTLPMKAASIASTDEITADGASSSKFTYYAQYAYQVKSDYDIIAAYIKGEDGKYASRLFFVYDRVYEEWLRYDYSQMAAETFLSNWEEKDSNGTTLYVPVEKMSGDKKVWHTDNSKTAIDESKIPVIALSEVADINFAWKSLSDIPFSKNGGAYEYAGEAKEEEEPKPDPEPTPQPIIGDRTAETDINGHHYAVIWTGTVQYDGRAHVWNRTKISAKNAAKQVADLKVEILRDGALVDASNYSVSCKNNTSITHVNGNSKYQPYFSITLKGTYKKDNAKMSKAKLPFDIKPCPVTDGKFQAKKVVVQGSKTTFTNLYFVFSDGRKVKLEAYNAKKKTGSYTATGTEAGIMITGYNNLSGEGLLSMDNPKKVTYEW